MKKLNTTVETLMKKAVNHMVDTELDGWPPQCATFLYQPVRPEKTEKALSHNEENLHK